MEISQERQRQRQRQHFRPKIVENAVVKFKYPKRIQIPVSAKIYSPIPNSRKK